jgi:hypothetical protein
MRSCNHGRLRLGREHLQPVIVAQQRHEAAWRHGEAVDCDAQALRGGDGEVLMDLHSMNSGQTISLRSRSRTVMQ